ncbi:MAG: type II toxin-antitoxin system prevent-host-death family antitoxin [Chloroflexi bacterium]|nr:type II toxin-antitoxin system prevent-host-death family antitoxin [Chloroflexota bacterium]
MTTTYGIREFKTKVSEILHDLDDGEEVIITRHGKPCAKLVHVEAEAEAKKLPLSALKDMLDLPDATWEDFMEAKKIWEPRIPDDL